MLLLLLYYYYLPYTEKMVLDLLGYFPLLLLLLGLWRPTCPLCAWPQSLTKAHWFEIQHIQSSALQCSKAMRGVNNYTQHCKPQNTFLHASFQHVAAVCDLPNTVCRNGRNNCHRSLKSVNMTQCMSLLCITSVRSPSETVTYCIISFT